MDQIISPKPHDMFAFQLFSPISACTAPVKVSAPAGILKGVCGKTRKGRRLTSFKGIPYALPPTGGLRFARPQPFPEPGWKGVRKAYKEGPGRGDICTAKALKLLLISSHVEYHLRMLLPMAGPWN